MYCQKCGELNVDEALFCKNCGGPLKEPEIKFCSVCNAENDKNAAFCNKCGTSFSQNSGTATVGQGQQKIINNGIKEFHFYWKGRFTLLGCEVEVFLDDNLIGIGNEKKGFDFVSETDLSETKFHQVKIKIAGDNYFNKLVDFSKFRKGLVEFEYKDSLFNDSVVLKED